MTFTLIDRDKWKRKEYFEHYHTTVPCCYSMTVKLDITSLRRMRVRLYPSLLYVLSKAVNRYEEFRTAFDAGGNLGIYDCVHPCYTVFHRESETFSAIWTEYSENYAEFMRRYEQDMRLYGHVEKLEAKPGTPQNVFNVSMIPWESFESFNLTLLQGNTYFLPIITLGRFYQIGERFFLPVAVQVHHAVCDGFHVCRLFKEIREVMACQFSEEGVVPPAR